MYSQQATFPDESWNIRPEGLYQIKFEGDINAISMGACRHKPWRRSFLERHTRDAVQLKKIICAMLKPDESAFGDSLYSLSQLSTSCDALTPWACQTQRT